MLFMAYASSSVSCSGVNSSPKTASALYAIATAFSKSSATIASYIESNT